MLFTFGDCELDESCFELRRRGKPVRIEPKVFDVLVYLIAQRDRVVTKHEVLDALWPGESVSDSVLPRSIAALRRAVGDTRTRQKVIATVHGRGYRFVGAVDPTTHESDQSDGSAPLASASASRATAAREQLAPNLQSPEASDFVGRVDAVARLDAGLRRALRGEGGVALVVGEPGIGKTRLAEESASRA